MFKKFLSIFLINLLVFYQIAFFIPPVFAQEAIENAIAGLTTEESLPEPSMSPTPSTTEELTPPSASVEPSSGPEILPEPDLTPTPVPSLTPTPVPSLTPTPVPSLTPILDVTNETEASASASLSGKSTIRPAPFEKKIKIDSNKNYVEGQVLVKFKENKINLKQVSNISKAKEFAETKNLDIEETIEKNNVAVLKTKGESVEGAIDRLENDSSVQYAEPNYIRTPAVIASNDTSRNELWGLDNFGQTVNGVTSTSDADIDALEAWGLSEGTGSIVVAVIDSGVAYNHPDLQANMWNGANCKNEDGVVIAGGCNHGYDYEDSDNTPLPTNSSHGTHIAGTIAAVKNNNKGIIGTAPSVKIMALKFSFDIASEVRAIDFAIQNGAKIINASYTGLYSQTEYDAINRFKAAGGIFIAAAGNRTVNNDTSAHSYPSDYDLDNIISVAATDQNDTLADFSNYGATSVDVAAPGVNIYSTVADILSSQTLDETFESVTLPALPTGWTKTGDWGTYDLGLESGWGKVLYGDVVNLPYKDDVAINSNATSPTFNLSGSSKATINFWAKCDTEYSTSSWKDYMMLETSGDGATFSELIKWDESELDFLSNGDLSDSGSAVYYFEDQTIPSSQLTANFKFRFKWVTNGNSITGSTGDGCLVDDIKVTKFSLGSAELYDYYQGTSMAAPHVAGLAALILSHNSSRTYSQVKSIILNTGDTKASLSGKTVSGKRVNAYNALLAANGPVIVGLSDDANSTRSKTWSWSSTDTTAQFRFLIDQSSSWTPTGDYSSTTTATQGSGNGTYYLHVQAKNSSGIESEAVTVSAVLDNTAPTTPGTPIPSPSSPANQTTQTWNWTAATDTLSGIAFYFWSVVDNANSQLVDSGTTAGNILSASTSLLQGVWNFIVGAQDTAGNQSEVAGASLTVDTTPPAGSITAPANNSSHNTIPVFTASASDANTAVASVKFQYKASSADTFIDINTDMQSPYRADWTGVTLTTNTIYNLQLVITDTAGNPANVSGTSFTFDTTIPDAAVVTFPSQAVFVNADNFSITGTAEAGSLVKVKSDTIEVGSQQLDSSETAFSISIPLAQNATNSFTVTVTDAAGNEGPQTDVSTITEDSTNPSIVIYALDNTRISPAASIGVKDTATIDLLFSETVDANLEILNSNGTKVRDLYNSSGTVTNPDPKVWDGKNNSGNYVSEGVYTVKIFIKDRAGNSITDISKAITVNNAPLSLNPIGNKSVNEESKLTFTAQADDEEGGTLAFSLTEAPTGAAIDALTGAFSWVPTEAQGPDNYTFTVVVSSSTGVSESEKITVAVNEVNTSPVAAGSTQTIDEDTSKAITLFAADADLPANTLTYSIVSGPSHGILSSVSSDLITYTSASNYNGSDSFTFRANDGTVNSNTATVSITVMAVNDAPSFMKGDDQTIFEDAGAQTVSNWATNISAGPTNESGQIADFIVTNENNLLFSIQPSVAANGTLTYTPAANANGSATATVSLHDDGGTGNGGNDTSATQTFVITVNAVNDSPSFDAITNQNVDEDAFTQNMSITGVSSGPSNESDQAVVLSASSSNPSIIPNPTVSGSGSTRTLTYTPVTNANGTATITVTANDGQTQNNTFLRTFTITLKPVNDAPVCNDVNLITNEDTQGSVESDCTDVDGDSLTYKIVSSPQNGDALTGLIYNPKLNFNGLDQFSYKANDGLLDSNEADVNVTVNSVNDLPVIDIVKELSSDEDTALIISIDQLLANVAVTDVDEDTLSVIAVGSPVNGSVVLKDSNVIFTPSTNFNSDDAGENASFEFTISDGNDGTATATVFVKVGAVNDAPVITVTLPNGAEVWAGGSSHAITWSASDVDNASNTLVINLAYTTNGTDFTSIASGLTNNGTYAWNPVAFLNSSAVKIKATATDPDNATGTDLSNVNFSIDSTAPSAPGAPSTSPDPTNSTTQTWNWTAATDTLSGIAFYFWSVVDNANSQLVDSGTTAGNILSASTSLLQGVWNFIVGAQDTAGNQSSTSTDQVVVDTTAPAVTKLGNGSTDVVLLSPGDINLVFSEALSDSSKMVVENALTAGADKALTYSWSGGTLTITVAEILTFANDVVVNVSDIAGNRADLLLVDSALAPTQKAPDSDGAVTSDNTTPQVVITNPTQAVNITISSETTDPTIDVSSFISGGTGILPKITIDSEKADLAIPAFTVVTSADTAWNGVIAAPTITTVTLPETSGETKTVSAAIEIGLTGAKLSFDKAVRILLPGQAGKRAGYIRTGIAFTEISSTCSADNQTAGDTLGSDEECKINAGSDLVIWTKHFTKFVTYTQTQTQTQTTTASSTSSSSGSGGGGSSASSCNDQKPGNAPVLLSAVAGGVNSVTLTWSEVKDSVTYYLVAYGTSSGVMQYGNPDIGGKGTTSYTVQGLSGGKTYYFKVRAGNGCTPGDFSNEVSAAPTGTFITTPATGFEEGVLGESTDQPDQQQDGEEKGQGAVKGVEVTPTESPQEAGSFAQRNWPWMAVLILIISGTSYYLFIRRR